MAIVFNPPTIQFPVIAYQVTTPTQESAVKEMTFTLDPTVLATYVQEKLDLRTSQKAQIDALKEARDATCRENNAAAMALLTPEIITDTEISSTRVEFTFAAGTETAKKLADLAESNKKARRDFESAANLITKYWWDQIEERLATCTRDLRTVKAMAGPFEAERDGYWVTNYMKIDDKS